MNITLKLWSSNMDENLKVKGDFSKEIIITSDILPLITVSSISKTKDEKQSLSDFVALLEKEQYTDYIYLVQIFNSKRELIKSSNCKTLYGYLSPFSQYFGEGGYLCLYETEDLARAGHTESICSF